MGCSHSTCCDETLSQPNFTKSVETLFFLSPKNLEFDKVSEDWFIQIFWNVDLMVSFLTGYYDEGALIFSIPKIALHYAKTWLLFDLSLLSMDWAFRIMVPWMEVRFFGGPMVWRKARTPQNFRTIKFAVSRILFLVGMD